MNKTLGKNPLYRDTEFYIWEVDVCTHIVNNDKNPFPLWSEISKEASQKRHIRFFTKLSGVDFWNAMYVFEIMPVREEKNRNAY